MSGLFNYPKTFVDDEVLTNEDLNAQFETAKDNMIAENLEGASTVNNVYNANKAIAQVNPSPVGPTNFAASVEDEIKRLRHQISAITGESNYSIAPVKTISQLDQALLAQSQRAANFMMMSSLSSLGRAMRAGVYRFDGQFARDLDSLFSQPDGKFSSGIRVPSSEGIGINTDLKYESQSSDGINFGKRLTFGFFVRNPRSNSVLAYVPALNLGLSVNNSGNLILYVEGIEATSETAKAYQTIDGSVNINDGEYHHVCVSIDLSRASGSGKINLYVDGAEDGTQISTSTLLSPINTQIIRVLLCTSIIGFSNGLFTDSNSWQFLTNTPPLGYGVTGALSASGGYGLLGYSAANYITSTNSIDMGSAIQSTIIRFRAKVSNYANTSGISGAENLPLGLLVRDDSIDRSMRLVITGTSVSIVDNAASPASAQTVKLDTSIEHLYDVVIKNYTAQLYIDGALAITQQLNSTDSTASDDVRLGWLNTNGTSGSLELSMVTVKLVSSLYSGLYDVGGSTGVVDVSEPFILSDYLALSDPFLSSLQSNPVESIVLRDIRNYLPFYSISFSGAMAPLATSSTPSSFTPFVMYSDGDTDFMINMFFHINSQDPSFFPRVSFNANTAERFTGLTAAAAGGSVYATEGSANTETGVISGSLGIYLQSPTLIAPVITVSNSGSVGIFTLYGFSITPIRKG